MVVASGSALSSLQSEVNTLKSQVSSLDATLAGVSRSGNTLRFTRMNVQIENGEGSSASVNGLGNLILGYNESPRVQTGSHNLLLGQDLEFGSYGDIVDGYRDTVTGPYSEVLGDGNTVNGFYSSITAGYNNNAKGDWSAITGGSSNQASGYYSTVVGGANNLASDSSGSILGGCANITGTGSLSNRACGFNSSEVIANSVVGGERNTAAGVADAVLGTHDVSQSGVDTVGGT
jgi:hypothetical protein